MLVFIGLVPKAMEQKLHGFPVIENPSFEANSAYVWPGITPILGWNQPLIGSGLNPSPVHPRLLLPDNFFPGDHNLGERSFSNNGITPDGTNTCFLQDGAFISQNISGFEPGKTYVVTYFENARAGFSSPRLMVTLGEEIIDPEHSIDPLEPAGSFTVPYYRRQSLEFTAATSGPYLLNFDSANGLGDVSVLLDMISFVELGDLAIREARRKYQNRSRMTVEFSKPPNVSAALNPKHYSIEPFGNVFSVQQLDPQRFELSTSSLDNESISYLLKVQLITDQSGFGMFQTNSEVAIKLNPLLPADFSGPVKGFEDSFDIPSRDPRWKVRGTGGDVYHQTRGTLQVRNAAGSGNYLLFEQPGYHSTDQEILARIRMNSQTPGWGGIAASVDGNTGSGIVAGLTSQGMETFLATGPHVGTVGQSRSFVWTTNDWYWIRLRHLPNAAGGGVDVQLRAWLSDFDTAEPSNWLEWDYLPPGLLAQGFAGLAAGAQNQGAEFEVDYILIKADGFPEITPVFPPRPVYLEMTLLEGIRYFQWEATPDGKSHVLQVNDAAVSEGWIDLFSPTRQPSGAYYFEDDLEADMRFYRVLLR